jgi:EAL domain-containing protein (putative c-di-GMP-specific phosphodiesterase class I)
VRDDIFVGWMAEKLDHLRINPSNLVFELVEHGEAWDTQAFLGSLRDIRALGSAIALDDVGLAHSNLQRILDCDPEFLKLDRCIVHNCARDRRRQALLRSLELLAKDLRLSLIAEGVETDEEMDEVRSHDINLFQGFFFSKPVPASDISALTEARVLRKPPLFRDQMASADLDF